MSGALSPVEALPPPPSLLGESPLWHPHEQCLYWCDIPGHALHCWNPAAAAHTRWSFDTDVACCAALLGGGLLLACRDGLWRFDPGGGLRERLAAPPYDPATERFNDGKADPQGRLWVGTIYEPRDQARAALHRYSAADLTRMAGDITVSNGLAWSPDGATMYWADTQAHTVYAFAFDGARGVISAQRVFASFAPREPGQPLQTYGGRPDGAAVDAEGCYWVAMFEGARLLRLSPGGQVLREVQLPVRCPTMACFGGADLRTLFVTTACDKRPTDELEAMPLSGRVLQLRVDTPGLPTNFAVP